MHSAFYLLQTVSYTGSDGKLKKSQLLTSGFWGMARHMNYFAEQNIALSYVLPCSGYITYMYFVFTFVFMIHRVFRDEEKCRAKYGQDFGLYCQKVPYRFLPYIF